MVASILLSILPFLRPIINGSSAIGSPQQHQPKPLPIWQVPDGQQLYGLGERENWGDLVQLLAPFKINDPDNGEFYVEDEASEAHLKFIQNELDTSVDTQEGNLLSHLLESRGDNDGLLKQLLALGVNPDRPDGSNIRPSHICGHRGRPNMAQALSLCRPSLTAKNDWERTPMEEARHWNHTDVAKIWENLEKTGSPSLAQLAHDEKWFAVQNLCRRKVVNEKEGSEKYLDKTALEWASYHGRNGLAREMEYLLQGGKAEKDTKQSLSAKDHSTGSWNSTVADDRLGLDGVCGRIEDKVEGLGSKISSKAFVLGHLVGSRFGAEIYEVDSSIRKLILRAELLEAKIIELEKSFANH